MVKEVVYETPHHPFRWMYDADAHRQHRSKVLLWAAFWMHVVMAICAIFPHGLGTIFMPGEPDIWFFVVGYLYAFRNFIVSIYLRDGAHDNLLDILTFLVGMAFIFEFPGSVFWGGFSRVLG
jgi:hypothetical protein